MIAHDIKEKTNSKSKTNLTTILVVRICDSMFIVPPAAIPPMTPPPKLSSIIYTYSSRFFIYF
jgi:hypothetical protein